MISCSADTIDPFRCPTKWDLWRQLMGLLRRGRAWQSHEDVIDYDRFEAASMAGSFEVAVTPLGADAEVERLTIMQRWWAAYAEVLEAMHARACKLLDEMFCASVDELRRDWGTEYGFPDACAPWDSLCDKVIATGGSTCAYLNRLAARVGYTIECVDCAPIATADCAVADCTPIDCDCTPNVILVRIIAARSPAYVAATPFHADAAVADCTPPCAAPPDAVICLIDRFKPAHVKAIYEVV